MMKWKVVKNSRCSSVDRSLECIRNEIPSPQNNDSNNNSCIEQGKQDSSSVKENNKQRDSSITRKPSIVASDCINLKSFLGLSRQRSETNLSSIGLISTEPRRSRSEVRGTSCDRLTIGYHTTPVKVLENGKTRSSSPPTKSGCWLRGRKRERESRNPTKNNQEFFGKTIVTGSGNKKTNSKSRTIVDESENREKAKACPVKSSENRKSRSSKRNIEEDTIVEDVIYSEIGHGNVQDKLLDESPPVCKDPCKVPRKKGLAPKPNMSSSLSCNEVNLNSDGHKANNDVNCFDDKSNTSPCVKPPRKLQTFSCRNQDKKIDIRTTQSVKCNNLKNKENALLNARNKINTFNSHTLLAIAEVHKDSVDNYLDDINKNPENVQTKDDENHLPATSPESDHKIENNSNTDESFSEKEKTEEENMESAPFYIDTPDYSTLDSEFDNHKNDRSQPNSYSKQDLGSSNVVDDETKDDQITETTNSDQSKTVPENSTLSILRDASKDSKYSEVEPKKIVRFGKIDLLEKYKKNKAESLMEIGDDSDLFNSEHKPLLKTLDINSNEIISTEILNALDNASICSETGCSERTLSTCCESPTRPSFSLNDETCQNKAMTVNVLVKKPSSSNNIENLPMDSLGEDPQTQFVVKKSFVLTIAKQEKGFKSLCANKKQDASFEHLKKDHQISVTFLCSGPSSETWIQETPENSFRLRSMSVPPQRQEPVEVVAPLPPTRGRSRERRSKERQNGKKSKVRKKDAVFHMPQAVIDELSQVLEKRKPSLDEIPV